MLTPPRQPTSLVLGPSWTTQAPVCAGVDANTDGAGVDALGTGIPGTVAAVSSGAGLEVDLVIELMDPESPVCLYVLSTHTDWQVGNA